MYICTDAELILFFPFLSAKTLADGVGFDVSSANASGDGAKRWGHIDVPRLFFCVPPPDNDAEVFNLKMGEVIAPHEDVLCVGSEPLILAPFLFASLHRFNEMIEAWRSQGVFSHHTEHVVPKDRCGLRKHRGELGGLVRITEVRALLKRL